MKCNVLEEEIELHIAMRTGGVANAGKKERPFPAASYCSCITTIIHFEDVSSNKNNTVRIGELERSEAHNGKNLSPRYWTRNEDGRGLHDVILTVSSRDAQGQLFGGSC